MHETIADLRERLLAAGVKPRLVARFCAELADHHADLGAALADSGMEPEAAARLAAQRIGRVDDLAAAMLADPAARSMAARFPAVAYMALPLAGLAFAVAALASLLVVGGGAGLIAQMAWLPATAGLLLPASLGGAVLVTALRRRAGAPWPLAGIAATGLAGAMVQVQIALPMAADAGGVAVALRSPDAAQLGIFAVLMLAAVPLARRLA